MPTIRIDDEVYSWLKSQAVPFEDTPNSILRNIAGLDGKQDPNIQREPVTKSENDSLKRSRMTKIRWTGKLLKELWQIDTAKQVLYHKDGTFYENLRVFPGALCDEHGYIIIQTERVYNDNPHFHIGKKLNVHRGISKIPGYKSMEKH